MYPLIYIILSFDCFILVLWFLTYIAQEVLYISRYCIRYWVLIDHSFLYYLLVLLPELRLTLLPQNYKMISTVEVPHLKTGQKIKDYKRLYKAATVGYKEAEKLGCLAIYIHRTEGETELAYQASEKETLDAAFKFLEQLIDGPPCEFLQSVEFFAKKPSNGSMDAVRSYFFELYEVSKTAKIPTDVFLKRFPSQVPSGKKLYDSNKDKVKAGLDSNAVTAVFQVITEKLQKKIKEERV